MKCEGCLKYTNNYVCCTITQCKKCYCNACIDSSKILSKSTWKCTLCNVKLKKGCDNTQTPIREDSHNITLRKKQETAEDVSPNDVRALLSEIKNLTSEISSLKGKFEEATVSLSRCHERLEELRGVINTNVARIKELEHHEKENQVLRATVAQLEFENNIQNQAQLRNELEISGIPETPNESLGHVVLLAAHKIGVSLNDNDIDWITRVGPKARPSNSNSITNSSVNIKPPRPIVIRLLRRNKRDELLKSAKQRQNVISTDLDLPDPPQKIFFNERLTKHNRYLFREARIRAKEMGFAQCFCAQGYIYIRKENGKSATRICTISDLDRFTQDGPKSNCNF